MLTNAVRREDQAGRAERDPLHVVQIDEHEREHDAVPERVREAAELQQLHIAGEARVEAAEPAHEPKPRGGLPRVGSAAERPVARVRA